MPSEIDPLLPQSRPAPEISGYGFSKPSKNSEFISDAFLDPESDQDDPEEDGQSTTQPSTSTQSSLVTIISIFTAVVFFAFVLTVMSPEEPSELPPAPRPPRRSEPNQTVEERAAQILDGTPLIDGHNDLAIAIYAYYKNHIHTSTFRDHFEDGGMQGNLDLPRLRTGKVGGAFWSAFVPCPNNASSDFSDSNYASATSLTLSQIDLIRRLQHSYPDAFTPATTPLDDALAAFHAKKKLISPISIEGLHQVPQSAPMSTLRLYHTLGVRAATLTWNCHNAFADAALISDGGKTVVAPYHRDGLTPLGRRVIHELNRLGMLIDLSHTSYWTQKAVLSNATSLSPVIFSHSSAFSLCPHPRNVHDDILGLVRNTSSLVMINFTPDFISCLPPANATILPPFYQPNNTLHQVARHIVYVGSKIGFDHVGIGSDFDGIGGEPPIGLSGVDKFPDLVAELLRMGVSDKDAAKIVGGNLIRVWKAAGAVAAKMASEGVLEAEDEVKGWTGLL